MAHFLEGFQANNQMGLFTFYKLQDPQQLAIINQNHQNLSSESKPKDEKYNQMHSSNIDQGHKLQKQPQKYTQSVIDIRIQNTPQKEYYTKIIPKPKGEKHTKVRNKQKIRLKAHSVIDMNFGFETTRKNTEKQIKINSRSQRLKTDESSLKKQSSFCFAPIYLGSLHPIKINEMSNESIKDLFRYKKKSEIKMKSDPVYQQYEVAYNQTFRNIKKPSYSLQFSEVQKIRLKQLKRSPHVQKQEIRRPIKILKKQKLEPLNFLQYLSLKKRNLHQENKNIRLSKKINDILQIRFRQHIHKKLSKVPISNLPIVNMALNPQNHNFG